MKPGPPLELVIGSLFVDGMDPRSGKALARAFQSEFERLVHERPLPRIPPGHTSEWRLPVLPVAAAMHAPPGKFGKALARGLFEALQREAENS